MTKQKIIDGLYFTVGMILFNPLTGESKKPDELNEDDKTTYDACLGAIELLKAQEPHLIPYEKLDDYEVVWLQIRGFEAEAGGLTPWIQIDDHKWFSPYFPANSDGTYLYRYEQTFDSYGEKVRAWTSRPTDAQRKVIPWERLK